MDGYSLTQLSSSNLVEKKKHGIKMGVMMNEKKKKIATQVEVNNGIITAN